MRAWPALLLLSCTRPNPAFAVGDTGAFIDMSSGTADNATTDGPTTSAEPPVPTTGTSASAGETDSETTGGATCAPFTDQRIAIDPALPLAQCVKATDFFGKVERQGNAATISLCLEAECDNCGFTTPLDPNLAAYVSDGACLRVVHEGLWVVGDPEAPSGCKTTGLAIYDDDSAFPLYVASSRAVDAPSFLDAEVRLDVTPEPSEACTCALTDCCLDGQARDLRLSFQDQGKSVATLGPGEGQPIGLAGASYLLAVVRAHMKGYASVPTGSCVNDPETPFIDWHMLRLKAP